MVDIQSATAEIRRGKKEERKKQDKYIMSASATQGGHKNLHVSCAHEIAPRSHNMLYFSTCPFAGSVGQKGVCQSGSQQPITLNHTADIERSTSTL